MKRICTQIVTFCLLAIAQNTFAQSVSISTTDPAPNPPFGTSLAVNATNGFQSTNASTFNSFPKGQTTTITSPIYYYTTSQASIYFKYNFTTAAVGSTNVAAPVIKIITGSGTQTYTASALAVTNGTHDYYFTVTPATPFPANTNFEISLTMAVAMNDKAITANTLSANAFLAGSGAALPVKLVNFNGSLNKNTVQLQWLIAENETAEKFEIQKSTNGTSFSTEATVTATHTSGTQNYSFAETATADKVMYRLKMYDNNDKAEYSKMLVFNASSASQKSMQVLSNPVKDKLIISFSNESNETAQLHIYDNSGRMMQSQNISVSQGINTTTVALSNSYKPGLYIVELVTKTARLSDKIIYSNQ